MTVFQVIECTGNYEDYYERVLGTYMNKDRAIEEIQKCEEKVYKLSYRYDICSVCNYQGKVCYKPDREDDFCTNEMGYDELMDATYKLKEFEVIE